MSSNVLAELMNTFNKLWSEGGVKLAVDATAPGVVLPEHVVKQHPKTKLVIHQTGKAPVTKEIPVLVLHYPLHPVVPIDDLAVTIEGVRATLSFERAPYHTFVPWSSLLGMDALYSEPDSAEESPTPTSAPRKHGNLRSIP